MNIFNKQSNIDTTTNVQRNELKRLSHEGVKIEKKGSLVTLTMKATIFHQVWLSFIHLDTIADEVHNSKHVYQ